MDDRFKFRCWDDYNREMLDLQEQDTNPYNICDFTQNNIMQCTGLKDKNGNLIYEGDIISDKSNHIRVCVWEYDGFKYPALKTSRYFHKPISNKLEERKTDLRKNLTFQDNVYKRDKKEFVVIGNIYENKELIEVEK